MADESLEWRQAEMRSRMKSRARKQAVKQIILDTHEEVPIEAEQLPDKPVSPILDFGIEQDRSGFSITRQQLYNLVWTEPMIRASQRFQVSDVAVAKACRKHMAK